MESPQLFYRNDRLELIFPGWEKKQIDAVREGFIAWKRPRGKDAREDLLVAEPLALAMWEAKEFFPKLQVSERDREMLRHTLEIKISPIVDESEVGSLYPVQRLPTTQLRFRDKAILTAAPGIGKTVMSLVALRQRAPELVVIVAPLTGFDGWVEEIQDWLLKPLGLSAPSVLFHRWREIREVQPLLEGAVPLTVVLTTPTVIQGIFDDKIQSEWGQSLGAVFYDASHGDSFLIVDESFLYQERKTKRTTAMLSLAYNFKTVWLLSGMPVSTVSDDLYSQLRLLYPATFSSYWKFVGRYCLVQNSHWGTKVVGDKPGATERLQRDLADILIRCEYPTDIPDWETEVVECPMGERQEAIYRSAVEELVVDAATLGADEALTATSLLTLTVRTLQIASNPLILEGHDESGKWDKLLEILPQRDLPALVWVKFRTTAKLITQRIEGLGLRVGMLTGATKAVNRHALVKQFQAGELDVLVLNDAVGKYSLTLTAARIAYYLERDYNSEAYYQSLFRGRRITSQHPIRIVSLLSTYRDGKPTVDRIVHTVLQRRSRNAQLLTVGQLLGSI